MQIHPAPIRSPSNWGHTAVRHRRVLLFRPPEFLRHSEYLVLTLVSLYVPDSLNCRQEYFRLRTYSCQTRARTTARPTRVSPAFWSRTTWPSVPPSGGTARRPSSQSMPPVNIYSLPNLKGDMQICSTQKFHVARGRHEFSGWNKSSRLLTNWALIVYYTKSLIMQLYNTECCDVKHDYATWRLEGDMKICLPPTWRL